MSTVSAELAELEPKLKEILYRCLEEIKATKAALYLTDGGEAFALITQYGFRENLRKQLTLTDASVDRLIVKRAPFFVNGLAADPRFSELLYESDTSRILLAPVYSRGKLIGVLDLRDKAGKQDFGSADLTNSQRIIDQFLDLFSQKGLFGQRPPTLTGSVKVPAAAAEDPVDIQTPSLKVLDQARQAVGRGSLRPRAHAGTLTDEELSLASAILPSILALPGVVVAALSSFGKLGGVQTLTARSTITDDALKHFDGKLRGWLKKRGEADPSCRITPAFPFGTTGPVIDTPKLSSILSAPVSGPVPGLVLSVAFDAAPDASVRTSLERSLGHLQQIVESMVARTGLRETVSRVAEKLLEPDFQKFPILAAHSKRVSDLAERLAQFIGLSAGEVETVRIAALVHDVGMRLLDYQKLYRKQTPTTDDLRILHEHPLVGAAMIAESPLGPEIATIVLCHHERPDGTGYPNGLAGENIPLASRIIHLCESFDAMTAPDSYQPPVPAISAAAKIKREAGTQFDADLVNKFQEMLAESSFLR